MRHRTLKLGLVAATALSAALPLLAAQPSPNGLMNRAVRLTVTKKQNLMPLFFIPHAKKAWMKHLFARMLKTTSASIVSTT